MKKNNFIFKYRDIILNIKNDSFISIVSNSNESIFNTFLNNKEINTISYKDIFNKEYNDVFEEINAYVKNNNKTKELIKKYNLNNKTISDKVKLNIIMSMINNKIIVINNVLNLLDIDDYKIILKALKSYSLKGHTIFNITNISEETMFGDKLIVIYNDKLLYYDEVLNVLNNEKIMKRIGLGLPFIVELNKYLIDYGLIDNYYLSNKKLVGALWE